jgi:hypothetical protein
MLLLRGVMLLLLLVCDSLMERMRMSRPRASLFMGESATFACRRVADVYALCEVWVFYF